MKRRATNPKKAAPPKKVKETRSTAKKALEEAAHEAKESGYAVDKSVEVGPIENEPVEPETPWQTLIRSTTVKDICKEKASLIVLSDKATLNEAMAALQKNNILSLPVVNDIRKKFKGFIDVLDIAGFVFDSWRKTSVGLGQKHFPGEDIFETPAIEAVNYSNVDYAVFIDENQSVETAIEMFCNPKAYFRLHRLAVTQKGKVVNILSQSDVVNWAQANSGAIDAATLALPISEISGLIRTPISVRVDTPFSEALESLYRNRISGLALLDHQFKLCGNLSASDLRGMNALGFDFFNGSVLQFLIKGTDTGKPKVVSQFKRDNTFADVLQCFTTQKVHRLYITDDSEHPIGFISLIDIIARLNLRL